MGKKPLIERKEKGKSLIVFPKDYVVIDIETTGLSPRYDFIIEVSAIKVAGDEIVDRFESLVKPDLEYDDGYYVNSFIEEYTGITNKMLAKADETESVLKKYANFIGDSTVIGHNVNFDVNFLYDNFDRYLGHPFTNNFVDTMRIYKKLTPEKRHHRLRELCDEYGLVNEHEHRAYSDCEVTAAGFLSLRNTVLDEYGTYDKFKELFKPKKRGPKINPKSIVGDPNKADPDSPLYKKHCVFTGKLERFLRRDAWQIVANLGGIPDNSVTKKTNFLILGNNEYCKTIKDGKSSKQKKAEKYKLEGLDIEILPETVFYEMIEDEYQWY